MAGREDQEFLFSSLQDNWRHQTAGGAAASDSSLSPTVTSDSSSTDTDSCSPKPASSDPVEVKQEIKEEPVEHQGKRASFSLDKIENIGLDITKKKFNSIGCHSSMACTNEGDTVKAKE